MQLSSQARKAMAAGLAASTLLMGVANLAPRIATAAVHSEGCLVLSGGTVWMITNGTRRGYTSAEVFQSWGRNFSEVVNASAEDVALPVGPIQVYADGTLLKGPNDPLVYLVTGGQKRPFVSGSVFTGLGFSFANIQSAPVNTFQDLPTGANMDSTQIAHPAGVQVISNGAVWWMDNNGRRAFASAAMFNSYGYMFSHVVQANSFDLALPNLGDVPARPSCTGGGTPPPPPPVSGSMSVALSSDNPASRAVVTNEGQADLAHFTFTGNAVVNSVTLKRIGVSADTSLSNVFLFDGATRLTDASSVSSGSLITFNSSTGLFSVNGSKNISVRADMAASAGETVGIQLVSAMSGTVAFSGTPVSANLHTIATASLATVALATATGSGNSDPGNDITLWQDVVTVGIRDVLMSRLALRQIGSVASSDINTFKLYVDGSLVQTVTSLDSMGYVTFNTPVTLRSGSRTVKVSANVIGGSNRTVQLSLRGAYDISATDTQYNAGVTATGSFPVGPSAFTVNPGTMTVVKTTDSQSQNVTVGASDQSLAKYTFTAFGEPVKVETLKVGMITTGGVVTEHTIRNVKLMVNGAQVGSTTNVPAAASFAANTGTSFTTNFTVMPGSPTTVEIRGDMVDSEDTDNIAPGTVTAVQALLVGGAGRSNGIPQVSLTPINVPSATNVLGNSLTIASGSISLAQTSNYGAQTIVTPQTAYKIGSYVLSGNATEAVNLNTLYVAFSAADTGTASTDLTNLYVKYGEPGNVNTMTSPKGTVTDTAVPASSNSFPINHNLPVNGSLQVDVYADVATSLSTNNIISTLSAAGVTTQSGIAVYADSNNDTTLDATGFTGQTITGGTGSITVALDGSTPVSAIIDDSGTVTTAAFKFSATNDSYTITDVRVTLGDASAVSTVALADVNGAPIAGASKTANTTVNFNGLNIAVPANSNVVIKVQLTLAGVGVGSGTSGGALTTTLVGASTSVRSSGGTTSTLSASGSPAGNAIYVYKAIPTITPVALPSTTLTAAGTYTVAKFTISSTGGPIGWQSLTFTIARAMSGTDTLATPALWDVTGGGSGTQITTTGSYFTGSVETDGDTGGALVMLPTSEQLVSGSKTYELRMALAGTFASNDYITVNVASVSSYATNAVAFAYYSPTASTKSLVHDLAAGGTITAGDIRETANASVVVTQDATTVMSTAVNNVRGAYGMVSAADQGKTVIVTAAVNGGGDDYLNTITGTLESGSAFTCTGYTAVDGGGSAMTEASTVLLSTLRSVKCVATGKQIWFNVTGTAEPGAISNTITLATVTDGGYAVGSAAAANNSDLNTVLTAGVPVAASFVWSDQSAGAHANTTADWASDALVQSIATASQTLAKP